MVRNIAITVLAALLLTVPLVVPSISLADDSEFCCSQPNTCGRYGYTGPPLSSDCFYMLRIALGLMDCPGGQCYCDTNSDGRVTSTDALACLGITVGVLELPPCCTPTTTSVLLAEPPAEG